MSTKSISISDIIEVYQDELANWDYFSDPQRCYLDEDGHIVVCLRDYNWYITKEKITEPLECIKALFEVDWIAEYSEDDMVNLSTYWKKF